MESETRPTPAGGQQARRAGLLPAGCTALAALLALAAVAQAAPRKARPPGAPVPACPYDVPDDITAPVAAGNSPSSAKDDNPGDDSSDDDDDDDSSDAGGIVAAGGCLQVGGEADAGVTISRVRLKGVPSLLTRTLDTTVYDAKGTLTFGHVAPGPWGDVITRLSIDVLRNSSDISEASIQFGPAVAGMTTSFFDAWAADEFSFRSLASSQSPALLGWVYRPSDASSLSVSAEDNTYRRVTLTGYDGVVWPDLVGRARYVAAPFDFTLSAAWRQTRVSAVGADTIQGVAALASVRLDLPTANDGSYLLAQGAVADKALGYLGVNTTSSVFRLPIGGILNADVAERGRGWNGVAVANWQLAPTWSSAAFASIIRIDVPGTLGTGRFTSFRAAANVTWEPVEDFSMTAEFGYARFRSGVPLVPSSSGASMILSMSRSF